MTNAATYGIKRAALTFGGAVLISIGAPFPSAAQSTLDISEELSKQSDELQSFYAARNYRPLWLASHGQSIPAVADLLDRVETAHLDAIDREMIRQLSTKKVRRALRRAAEGDADDVARAETELSRLFVRYVNATRTVRSGAGMIYGNESLVPSSSSAPDILHTASQAESLEKYIREFGWMHPLYAPLREAMAAPEYSNSEREVIWRNLDRIRGIPSLGRHVLVDTAGARLWMYEDGKPVDSMRVVVGKPETQTPTMAGYLRHAIVNPYWNVPIDLVQQNIATNVLDRGLGYLEERRYEVLSDYSDRPAVLDPQSIKWEAVAEGKRFVRVRQKPGNSNFMGKAKFEFPNQLGIYLHDTPDKHLLSEHQRHLSAGCVRLEDAARFGRWLLGKPLPKVGKEAEQRIEVSNPVPIYITHLTAFPSGAGIAFRPEVYRGTTQLANVAY